MLNKVSRTNASIFFCVSTLLDICHPKLLNNLKRLTYYYVH